MDDLSSGEARRKAWAPKTLFIADPMESYNVKHDSTFLIAKTLAEQYPRAKLFFCKASDLMALGGVVFCKGRAFEFLGAPDPQPGSPLSMAAGCKPWFRYVEAKAEDFPTRPDPGARAESRLENGTVAQETLFADAHSANKTMAWILRVLGIVLVCSGLGMLLRPLSVVADVLPFLGDLVGAGTGLVAFLLGLAWSFIIIAIAWLAYRPLLGGGLLAAAIALIVLIFLRRKKRAKAPAQE